MTPATIILGLFDWRGVMSRAAYRRNLSILVVLNLLIRRLDLLSGAAAFGWMALVTAIGLSLDARRYHDMGRSAAWIVWVNFIAAALAVAIFQLVPNVLGAIPLPEGWRVDAAGEAIIGRLIIPALVGAIGGNLVQSVWLASAPSGGQSLCGAGGRRPARTAGGGWRNARRSGPASDHRSSSGHAPKRNGDADGAVRRRWPQRTAAPIRPARTIVATHFILLR
jgi:hypothetical protein